MQTPTSHLNCSQYVCNVLYVSWILDELKHFTRARLFEINDVSFNFESKYHKFDVIFVEKNNSLFDNVVHIY